MAEIAIILFGLILIAVAVWCFHPRVPQQPAEPEYTATVRLVLDMLNQEDGWLVDGYRATHVTGASIWIANKPDDAGLSLDGNAWPVGSSRARNVSTTKAERRVLFLAAKALLDRQQVSAINRATVEWAGRVKQHADNVVSIRGAA